MVFRPDALKRLVAFLETHGIRYAVVGGIANAYHGSLRTTEDADVKVLPGGRDVAELRQLLESAFARHERPNLGRAASPLVISLEIEPGMVADVLVGVFPYEESVVDRALSVDYEGATIAVCTAEDLIIHKAIADRPKDWVDIEGIVRRQHGKLDLPYVRKWLREWGEALETDLAGRFESLLGTVP